MSNSTTVRNYKFRLYPSKSQVRLLERALEIHRQLYNAALQERCAAWRTQPRRLDVVCGVSIGYTQQANQLKDLRTFDDDAAWLNYTSVQQTLRKLDKAFQAFFRRVKASQKAGYPRFKSRKRWKSVAYVYGDGVQIRDRVPPEAPGKCGRLRVQNVGRIKTVFHRDIPEDGVIKQVVVKRESPQHWWATFAVELPQPEPLPVTGAVTGIDVGLSSFITMSNGEHVANPRFLRRDEKVLAKAQRRQSRERKGSAEWRKRGKVVAKRYRCIRNRRDDFTHKLSRKLIDDYQLIAFENLQIKNMQQNRRLSTPSRRRGLGKSISDAAWGQLLARIVYKAEEAGRVAIAVNPRGTSQRCSGCGETVQKSLSVRVHACPNCGLQIDRDHNAALNILGLGLQSLGASPRSSPLERGE